MEKVLLDAALRATAEGISTVPVKLPEKTPTVDVWKWREKRIPDETQIRKDYRGTNGNSGVAIIGGDVSGHTEYFDFDIAGEFFEAFSANVEASAPGLIGRLPLEKTLNGGFHLLIKCPSVTIPGSQKLARKKVEVDGPGLHEFQGKTYPSRLIGNRFFIFPGAIETKAEGGYIVCAPSPGYTVVHPGENGAFLNIPAITEAERETLLRCARALDEMPPEAATIRNGPKPATPGEVAGMRPGDDFNRRGDVTPILLKHGCQPAGGTPERQQWTRPGKPRGISFTIYDGRTMRMFSSNFPPFEIDTNYSALAILAMLDYGGDFSAAARALRREGYGDQEREKLLPATTGADPEMPKEDGANVPKNTEAKAENTLKAAVLESEFFIAKEMPEKIIYLNPWLSALSIILITGARGIGKSWFLLALLMAIVKFKSFGPWDTLHSVPCLYLDGEMAAQDAQERLIALDQDGVKKSPLFIYSDAYASSQGLPRANLLNPEWRAMMKALLLELGVKVWAVDNIASLTPGIDENSKQEWDPINQWLLELRFNEITTVLAHHTNRTGGQRGTSGREDNIDISILLKQPEGYTAEDGASFIVSFTKARIAIPHLSKIADTAFQMQQDKAGKTVWTWGGVKQQRNQQIVALHLDGIPNKEIAKELKCSIQNVYQVIKRHENS